MPSQPNNLQIPAAYMRGGTSKGVFFRLQDLPEPTQSAGRERDQLLQRIMGSPDLYGKQIDGMGGASSSTSKVVLVSKSTAPDHDVDYLFAQVSIDSDTVDWSGNCGNLSAAVGPFAIANGLLDATRIPENGSCTVRIWQQNIQKTIIAHVPIRNGLVQEAGDFELDGVAFPSAQILLEFLENTAATTATESTIFPTGNIVDELTIPDIGIIEVTLTNAGIPTVFIRATDVGLTGSETQADINGNAHVLQKLEMIRAHGAVKMGLIEHISQAQQRQHTPKIVWLAPAADDRTSSGKIIRAQQIGLRVRALSMGQMHHAIMGTAAIAIGAAAAVHGTLVNQSMSSNMARENAQESNQPNTQAKTICFGHPSGTLTVGVELENSDGKWLMKRAQMSRSARILMHGWVHVPADCMK